MEISPSLPLRVLTALPRGFAKNSLVQGIQQGIFVLKAEILEDSAQNRQIQPAHQGMAQGIAGISHLIPSGDKAYHRFCHSPQGSEQGIRRESQP